MTTKGNPAIDNFIEQYKKMQPRSAVEYNRQRAPGSLTWAAVARGCGLTKWFDLLDHCGLERPVRAYPTGRKESKQVYIVHSTSDLEERLAYLDSQEYWDSLGDEKIPFVPRVTNT